MAKNQKKILHLNRLVLDEFRKKFNKDVVMNFFSYKKVIISKSCFTSNLAYLLGNLNGICVNEWPEEKSLFDVLIISEIDCENIKTGNIFKDVHDAIININKRQTLISENKLSPNVYIIHEKDFLEFHESRQKYIDDNKTEEYNELELYRIFTLIPDQVKGSF